MSSDAKIDPAVYRPRTPWSSGYYRCVENHFDHLVNAWEDRYERKYGFWRPHLLDVIYKYLDCGDLHCGFARIRCENCGHEYLLAFSCKKRHFCPSCHQKRVVEYGMWLVSDVLKAVPHRHWVFSIPKRLRVYFLFDRKLLCELSRCAWRVIKTRLELFSSACDNASPGASISVHTFGDLINFNPHLHIIATDGYFGDDGRFCLAPEYSSPLGLDRLFRHEVLKMLKKAGKINDAVIENMLSWRNTGFNVYVGERIWPGDRERIEKLAEYIVRASFSQERMRYVPIERSADGAAKVIYTAKDGKTKETLDALDWLASLINHVPNPMEQMVRYYGYYSNKSRGLQKKANQDEPPPELVENETSSKEFKRAWAMLIRKVYEVDPLVCPRCQGAMRVISIIDQADVIKVILKHLGLWLTRNHSPPKDMDIILPDTGVFYEDPLCENMTDEYFS